MATLKDTLEALLALAGKNPGVPVRKELRHGLRVDVLVKDGTVHLQISRAQKWPADQEFTTTLKHWPWPVSADATPARKEHDGRCYLCTSFPVQSRLALEFEPGYSIEASAKDLGISLTVYDEQKHWVEGDWADNPREARHKIESLAKKYNITTVPDITVETVEVRA